MPLHATPPDVMPVISKLVEAILWQWVNLSDSRAFIVLTVNSNSLQLLIGQLKLACVCSGLYSITVCFHSYQLGQGRTTQTPARLSHAILALTTVVNKILGNASFTPGRDRITTPRWQKYCKNRQEM